jgi:hypothetical protein
MAEGSPTARSTFSTRLERARIRAAAALEAADYRCSFINHGDDLFLLIVEHEPGDTERVRRIVLDTEPDAMVAID